MPGFVGQVVETPYAGECVLSREPGSLHMNSCGLGQGGALGKAVQTRWRTHGWCRVHSHDERNDSAWFQEGVCWGYLMRGISHQHAIPGLGAKRSPHSHSGRSGQRWQRIGGEKSWRHDGSAIRFGLRDDHEIGGVELGM